jgi:hypothetical protein
MCLDSSSGAPLVQVFTCGDDYSNQWWHISRVEGRYVTLEIERRNQCLTSPAGRPATGDTFGLVLRPCAKLRTQQWLIISG